MHNLSALFNLLHRRDFVTPCKPIQQNLLWHFLPYSELAVTVHSSFPSFPFCLPPAPFCVMSFGLSLPPLSLMHSYSPFLSVAQASLHPSHPLLPFSLPFTSPLLLHPFHRILLLSLFFSCSPSIHSVHLVPCPFLPALVSLILCSLACCSCPAPPP